MSYTELHIGKLKPIYTNMPIEEFKDWLEKKEGLEVGDFEELLKDESTHFEVRDKSKSYKESMCIKFIYNKGTLYEMVEHSGEQDTDFLHLTTKNEDDTINFTYLFYNGGTCFSEMMEEGLEKIHKSK
jgi:hypothetical protein